MGKKKDKDSALGGAVASLLTDDNLWITGQRIEVSGGTFL
jgi:hypothetical protein